MGETMIAVIVTFQDDQKLDRHVIAKIASEVSNMFRGMPGLRTKAFTIDEDDGRARNIYLWDDADAARAFFNEELRTRVTGLYGVEPTIEFVDVLELVDNS
jgi:hypothetical protein